MRLKNKTALVTGAASGFGREIAKRFIAEGANVAIVDLNEKGAQEVASELGNNAVPIKCNVAVAEDIERAVNSTFEAFGSIDIVINNAGWSHANKPLLDIDEATFRKVYDINVLSIFHMTHAIVPKWRSDKTNGVMINVGSTAGIRPRPGLTWYNTSKAAVNMMTKALAVELAPDKIRVCGLAPVMGATGLLETFMGVEDSPENRQKFIDTIPLGRLCESKDMANAALFLSSDEAEFLTGVILEVDGGRTI